MKTQKNGVFDASNSEIFMVFGFIGSLLQENSNTYIDQDDAG